MMLRGGCYGLPNRPDRSQVPAPQRGGLGGNTNEWAIFAGMRGTR